MIGLSLQQWSEGHECDDLLPSGQYEFEIATTELTQEGLR